VERKKPERSAEITVQALWPQYNTNAGKMNRHVVRGWGRGLARGRRNVKLRKQDGEVEKENGGT